mmetsp:Transcript_2643/g.10467  ORF Transcript_2643/g.10467 Transcript_2643/m.10467 type:complete len:280 (-) Transcript_2643:35-874(-)
MLRDTTRRSSPSPQVVQRRSSRLHRRGALVRVELRVELRLRERLRLRRRLLGSPLLLLLRALRARALRALRLGLGRPRARHHLDDHLLAAAGAARAAAAHARDRDAAGERDPPRRAADELDAQRAPVELHAVVRLDGLHGVLAAREDHLGGALAAAILVKVQTRLLHLADLREEFLDVLVGDVGVQVGDDQLRGAARGAGALELVVSPRVDRHSARLGAAPRLGDHFGLDASDLLAGGGLALGPGLGLLLAAAAPLLLGGGLDHRVEGLVDIHGARTRV